MTKQALTRMLRRALVAVWLMPCLAAAQSVQENTLKAAFVYNFALFTEWPKKTSNAADSLTICFHADSDMRDVLGALDGKPVRNMVLKTRVLGALEQEVVNCNVLFIDRRDRHHWHAIRKKLAGTGVLTVTDDEDIGRGGAMIALSLSGSKMVFDIDQSAARQAGLVLSSKLLRLARTVR
ncbi:MAG: YfiR family protein [Burkholderiaceae bacterium]|nr:YfiR family protein [Burkholderiaceae bacterium]